jgi:3-oxoacyl-[acyl-carrier-protein] synthase III
MTAVPGPTATHGAASGAAQASSQSLSGTPGIPGTMGVTITGTGIALAGKLLTNDDLSKIVDTNDEWIMQRTGIRERRVVSEGQTIRDLAGASLKQALDNAGLKPSQLDMLLCATMTPEMACPTTATRVAAEIGATPAGAMDLTAACSGFVYGLNLAAALVGTGFYKNVGVIGAEVLSQIVDWKDRRTCVLFGDGAGAAIVSATPDKTRGCLYQSMASDGGAWADLYIPRVPEHVPQHHGPHSQGSEFSGAYNTLQMNGREVYKFAVHTLENTIHQALNATGLKPSDLSVIIPHQSNRRILESARERLGLGDDKLYINIDRFGNTSAASVPLCLHELTVAGRVKPGDLVLFVALGGGLTWASSLWRV